MSEAVQYLKRYQAWRTGEDYRTMDEAGINPSELTAAINVAIEELERWQSVSRLQDVALDKSNERIGELTAENEYLAREMLTPDVFMRLIEWLREDPIKPASLAFTSGIARQIAYALEDEVVPLIKSARMVKSQLQPFQSVESALLATSVARSKLNAMKEEGWRVTGMAVKRGDEYGLITDMGRVLWFDDRDAAHWKANHDAQVARARVLVDRIDMPFERVNAYNDYAKFKTGYDRYEAVRKLNVPQFAELFKRSLAGERFDDMVDELARV